MAAETWILAGELEALSPVAEAVRAMALPILGPEAAGDVELALVEAATNVVRHGYGPEGGPIRIEALEVPSGLLVRICDWGQPIPGEALAGAGLSRFDFDATDLAALPEGGMGLSLITAVMDEVTYRSDEGQNVLTLLRKGRA